MRLIKAEVVGHFDSKSGASADNKKPRYVVYSVDVQPNSNRLATGGGGI
jgi:hypothetical protein